jgi:LysM repeat protein
MTKDNSVESNEPEHSYLDVGPVGPRKGLVIAGALLLVVAVTGAFFGLYTINRDASPTLTPDPLKLTQAATVGTPIPGVTVPGVASETDEPTTLPTATLGLPASAAPFTYTVRPGDTLIGIAYRFNVSVEELKSLNQISGETIFPNQVLTLPPSVTPLAAGGTFQHKVSAGETLIGIAARYQVTVQEIKNLNGLNSDTIMVGQQLMIPATGVFPSTPSPTPEPWAAAVVTGDLEIAYSVTKIKGHFTLHILPDTRAAAENELEKVAQTVEDALAYTEEVLGRPYSGRFDVFVSDTLFAPPHTPRRAFSLPDANRLFLLYDGSGTPTERLYFTTYALTRLIATQKLGAAASPLLAEGLAVYAGAHALESETAQARSYLSPSQFCAAFSQMDRLPRVSGEMNFNGHLGYLDQYFAAGCFVQFLFQDNEAAFDRLYTTGDYIAIYGRSLGRLESDWIAAMGKAAETLPVGAQELVQMTDQVDAAYRRLWADFSGTPAQFAAYDHIDRARLSLLQGRLDAARQHLETVETLLEE